MTPLVRLSSITGYVPLVRTLGSDPHALLEAHRISSDLLSDTEAVVPYTSVIHLFEATAAATGRADFGLLMSRYQTVDDIVGPLALLLRSSQTVREGLESFAAHLHIYSPAIGLTFEDHDSKLVRYVLEINVPGAPQRTQVIDLSLATMYAILALAAGKDFRPEFALVRHDAECPEAAYQSVLHCPVRFDQAQDALVIRRDDLARRIDRNDPLLRRTVEDYVAKVIATRPMDIRGQVEAFVKRLLPTRGCTLQGIADYVSMHPRTLQRRLDQDGMGFAAIVDATRRQHTLLYLAQRQMPLSQVAGLVGYTEQSTFNRACLRWFDATPLAVRRGLRSGQGHALHGEPPPPGAATKRNGTETSGCI